MYFSIHTNILQITCFEILAYFVYKTRLSIYLISLHFSVLNRSQARQADSTSAAHKALEIYLLGLIFAHLPAALLLSHKISNFKPHSELFILYNTLKSVVIDFAQCWKHTEVLGGGKLSEIRPRIVSCKVLVVAG